MIDPNLKAKDRIHKDLPEDLQQLMLKYVLSDEEHESILSDIQKVYYADKTACENPKFIIVLGQTGSGKSNLTSKIVTDNQNAVVIDSDKYKGFRSDSEEILKNHLAEYAFLTAPDSYQHRDEMICETLKRKYNIIMECATSEKEGMFVDLDKIKDAGYKIELAVLGVNEINSLISIHERYESQIKLNYKAAKLTGIKRHDDSYSSLTKVVRDIDENDVNINVYERGIGFPFIPQKVYDTLDETKKFQSATEALQCTQIKDKKFGLECFERKYTQILSDMFYRNAPEKQLEQLESVRQRYNKIREQENNMER